MEKVNQRVALTKRLIQEALLRLLKKTPLAKVSVCALCEEAQINRTTFYRHYETPDDVLSEIAADAVQQFSRTTAPAQGVPNEKQFLLKMCEFLQANAPLLRTLVQSNADKPFAAEMYRVLSAGVLGKKTVLYRGKPVDEATFSFINSYFSAGIFALVRLWILEEVPKTPAEIADLIYSSFYHDFALQ